MKNLFLSTICLLSVTLCFATTITASEISCPAPQNVTKIAETSSSISFDWNDCFCSSQSFQVYFVKDGQTSATYQVSSSDFTFTNLIPGEYEFHFMTECQGVLSSEIIIIEDVVEG